MSETPVTDRVRDAIKSRLGNRQASDDVALALGWLNRLERELSAERAECERLREDAERYQMLLQRFYIADGMLRVSNLFLIHKPGASVSQMLETAIDAARGKK